MSPIYSISSAVSFSLKLLGSLMRLLGKLVDLIGESRRSVGVRLSAAAIAFRVSSVRTRRSASGAYCWRMVSMVWPVYFMKSCREMNALHTHTLSHGVDHLVSLAPEIMALGRSISALATILLTSFVFHLSVGLLLSLLHQLVGDALLVLFEGVELGHVLSGNRRPARAVPLPERPLPCA